MDGIAIDRLIAQIEQLDSLLVGACYPPCPGVIQVRFGFMCRKWWATLDNPHISGMKKQDFSGDTAEESLERLRKHLERALANKLPK